MYRPPKNDSERLQNLIEALSEPGDGDDALDHAMHAELARRGHTLESWAAHWQALAEARLAAPGLDPAPRRGRSHE